MARISPASRPEFSYGLPRDNREIDSLTLFKHIDDFFSDSTIISYTCIKCHCKGFRFYHFIISLFCLLDFNCYYINILYLILFLLINSYFIL